MGRKPIDKERIQNPDKKRAFVQKLMPIVQAESLHNWTMDQLASTAGVTKATLYKYFRSQEEIIMEIVTHKLGRLQAIEPIVNDTSIPYLERYLRGVRLFIDNFKGISTDFLSDLKEMYPAVWDQIEQFRENMNIMVGDFYQEGIDKGVLKDVHPAVLIMSDQLFFTRLIDPDFLQKHNLTIEDVFRDYFKVKLEGAISEEAICENRSKEIDNLLYDLSKEDEQQKPNA